MDIFVEESWWAKEGYEKTIKLNEERRNATTTEWSEILPGVFLQITIFTGPEGWETSKYTLAKGKEKRVFAEVHRNYSAYPHKVVEHSNGKRYFICGFNYQGYTIINIDDEITRHYLPERARSGIGWCPACWGDYDPVTNEIEVEGCYWACPYDLRVYDFSDPDTLPLPMLSETPLDYEEWEDDEEWEEVMTDDE